MGFAAASSKREVPVLLQGNLKEFSLPNIFQLVKMSAKSGALTIRRADEWGKIFFRNGLINYAFSVPQTLPLGERLVKSGSISSKQLKAALAEQKKGGEGARIGAILLRQGVIDRETLEDAVREQIQDTAFNFFSWGDGEFEFSADEVAAGGGHPRRDERRERDHGGLPPHRRVGAHLRAARLAGARAAPRLQRARRGTRRAHAHRRGVARRSCTSTAAPTSTPSCATAAWTASTAPRSSTACIRAASSRSATPSSRPSARG